MEAQAREQILSRLSCLYGPEQRRVVLGGIEELVRNYSGRISSRPGGWSEKDALLISYADSILGDRPPLQVLAEFLGEHLGDLATFVHLLPFYPYSSDDGFAVEDFRAVRPELGTWEDVARLAANYRLVFDAVINHVSASSVYMNGCRRGDPAWADFFIELEPGTDTSAVLRTRDLPLLHEFDTAAGRKHLWTTFSADQPDLNYANPKVLLEILDVLLFYASQGAAMLRLDAVPYLWKELGTSCAHLPQTHQIIKLIRNVFDVVAPHVLLLTETNNPHHENVTYFGDRGDEAQMIYNFALAPLILWSLTKGDASVLSQWAGGLEQISGRATYLNITATHDGIGMRPTEGILDQASRQELVQLAYDHNGDMTGKRNANGSVSPYELNLSYFDAVNDPNADVSVELQVRRFMVSQAIPLCLMGVPGVYIHSMLGSRNDYAGVKKSGRARSINRAQLQLSQVRAALAEPGSLGGMVFHELTRMLRLRGGTSAFHPNASQQVLELGPAIFAVSRHNPETDEKIVSLHNVTKQPLTLAATALPIPKPCRDILTTEVLAGTTLELAPYQVRWLQPAGGA